MLEFRKKRPLAGFSDTYDELSNSISLSGTFFFFFGVILFLCIFGLSVKLGGLSATIDLQSTDVQNLSFGVLIFFSILAVFFGFAFGIITNLFGVIQNPKVLIARLIITVNHPFKQKSGLAYSDIEKLKEVGKTEQSSSGWKSGFLSLALIWFLLENTEVMSNQLNKLVAYNDAMQNVQNFTESGLVGFGWSIYWFVISLLSALIANFLYRTIYDYLGNEPVNRGILRACIDAQSLLQIKNLDRKLALTIKDKQIIASTYGYFYVRLSQKTNYRFRASYETIEKGKHIYLLLISAKPAKT